MDSELTRPILAISADWQTRALVVAQVGETTGRDVVSAPGVNEALALVRLAGIHPVLLIVDAGQQIPPEDVERLVLALPETPLVLTVSALRRAAFEPLQSRCAAYLVRPVSIGQIAQAAAATLSGAEGKQRIEKGTERNEPKGLVTLSGAEGTQRIEKGTERNESKGLVTLSGAEGTQRIEKGTERNRSKGTSP